MAGEINLAAQWIYQQLSGDAAMVATLPDGVRGISQDVAPPGTRFPYVVFSLLDAGDTLNTTGPSQEIIWQPTLWLVKGVHKTASTAGALAALEQRIFARLHKQQATLTDGAVWSAVRVRPFQMTETGPGGESYRHAGGVYRIRVS